MFVYHLKFSIVKADIYFFPKVFTSHLGATVNYMCISDVPPKWFYEGGALPANVDIYRLKQYRQYWLRINDVDMFNAGEYTCHGEDMNNRVAFTDTVHLKVIRK